MNASRGPRRAATTLVAALTCILAAFALTQTDHTLASFNDETFARGDFALGTTSVTSGYAAAQSAQTNIVRLGLLGEADSGISVSSDENSDPRRQQSTTVTSSGLLLLTLSVNGQACGTFRAGTSSPHCTSLNQPDADATATATSIDLDFIDLLGILSIDNLITSSGTFASQAACDDDAATQHASAPTGGSIIVRGSHSYPTPAENVTTTIPLTTNGGVRWSGSLSSTVQRNSDSAVSQLRLVLHFQRFAVLWLNFIDIDMVVVRAECGMNMAQPMMMADGAEMLRSEMSGADALAESTAKTDLDTPEPDTGCPEAAAPAGRNDDSDTPTSTCGGDDAPTVNIADELPAATTAPEGADTTDEEGNANDAKMQPIDIQVGQEFDLVGLDSATLGTATVLDATTAACGGTHPAILLRITPAEDSDPLRREELLLFTEAAVAPEAAPLVDQCGPLPMLPEELSSGQTYEGWLVADTDADTDHLVLAPIGTVGWRIAISPAPPPTATPTPEPITTSPPTAAGPAPTTAAPPGTTEPTAPASTTEATPTTESSPSPPPPPDGEIPLPSTTTTPNADPPASSAAEPSTDDAD